MKEIDPKTANMLIKLASAKLGKSPEEIKSAISENKIENLTKNMNDEQKKKMQSIMSNPDMLKKFLGSDKAKEMLNNFKKK